MRNNFQDKAVLITGGTKGIGLGTGLCFAREGAHVYLTHKWGSANEDEVRKQFTDRGYRAPEIVEADVIENSETKELLARIQQDHDRIEVFVSNVCVVQPARGVESYKRRSLLKSLEYSAWPFVEYSKQIKKTFGHWPRYIIGISSDGPDSYFVNYEFVAASKAVMETFCKYMAKRLRKEDVRVNVLRTRSVLTDAVFEIFGQEYVDFCSKYAGEEYFMYPEEVGNAVLAMCSGMLDALNGQVLQVDKGISFADSLMRLLEDKERLGL